MILSHKLRIAKQFLSVNHYDRWRLYKVLGKVEVRSEKELANRRIKMQYGRVTKKAPISQKLRALEVHKTTKPVIN